MRKGVRGHHDADLLFIAQSLGKRMLWLFYDPNERPVGQRHVQTVNARTVHAVYV